MVLANKRPLFVRLIEMSLQIPSGQERRWEIKNHVCGVGCFKDFDSYRVTRSRLTAVKKREVNGVTIGAVESAGSYAPHGVERRRGRRLVPDDLPTIGECMIQQMELVGTCSIFPIDLKVVGKYQIAVESKALSNCNTAYLNVLSTACEAPTRRRSTLKS